MLLRFTVAFFLFTPAAWGQPTGTCAPGTAEAILDVSDVRATLFNGGNLFFGNTAENGYVVPKRSGNTAIFAANLWVGGKVEGELRVAAAQYHDFEFWPGPLGEAGAPPDDCAAYDRIWVVSRDDVERFVRTGAATDDLRDWPAHLGAPVLDGDGVPGNYDLAGGDQPAISGDQMAFWVMNDVGNEHESSGSPPIGMEVRASAFAARSQNRAIDRATFYRYEFHYRGDAPLDSAYVALWVDPDLGNAMDDYAGSDTTYHMAFTYNGREDDSVYGIPPALGIKVVQGPRGLDGGRVGMAAFQMHQGAGPRGDSDPLTDTEYYRVMKGLWHNGAPMVELGSGYYPQVPPSIDTTTYMFAGDPVQQACWSMEDLCEGHSWQPYDQRYMISSGPFPMGPGDVQEVVFAIAFAQGEDRLDSVAKLRGAANGLQVVYDAGGFAPRPVDPTLGAPEPPPSFGLSRPFPNPFRDEARLTLHVPEGAGPVRLAAFDVLGREVSVLADDTLPPGEHRFSLDGAALPAGLYVVRLEAGGEVRAVKVVRVE